MYLIMKRGPKLGIMGQDIATKKARKAAEQRQGSIESSRELILANFLRAIREQTTRRTIYRVLTGLSIIAEMILPHLAC